MITGDNKNKKSNSLLKLLMGWSDESKKVFSLISAFFLTILIIIIWFNVNSIYNKNNVPDVSVKNNDSINYLKESMQKISDQFNSVQSQIANFLASTTENATNTDNTKIGTSTAGN